MSRMEFEQNEALRLKGWSVFRSASRDRVIPSSGVGARLQRIKIAEALPVGDVGVGTAVSLEERTSRESARRESVRRAAEPGPSGITQTSYKFFVVANQFAVPAAGSTEVLSVGGAPFDGFLTEIIFEAVGFGTTFIIAIRTSGGGTFCQSQADPAFLPFGLDPTPDFFDVANLGSGGGAGARSILRSNIPVFAGEEIQIVMRQTGPTGALSNSLMGFFGFQSSEGVSRIGTVALRSANLARQSYADITYRESLNLSGRLALAQERTRQIGLESAARVEAAKLAAESRRPPSQGMFNPFQPLLLAEGAQRQLASRAPAPPPPPRMARPPAALPEGAGKTFVSAWNPSFGSIGYLIPDPPRGGKVNVFDNTYTIWDMSGKNVGSGPIIPVASDGDIPPGARISAVQRGTLSAELLRALDTSLG